MVSNNRKDMHDIQHSFLEPESVGDAKVYKPISLANT
jgi:hypothetical protein